ncbi:hypothetical protein SASPL_134856 [Salvia splendens]|uniref:Uncharacterized protein n=1 Tax=Salvia splendens TaxID=180675 RepID=A0A8X8WXJ3_SALSN|nr:hypothetical protein SASPL_134854 [Salvia splendens]KAG6402654.1 hypothetical protein SASPL_134856 [Salvia splendens]
MGMKLMGNHFQWKELEDLGLTLDDSLQVVSLGKWGEELADLLFSLWSFRLWKDIEFNALTKEAGANFIHIKGTELLKFVWTKVDVLSRDDFTNSDLEEDEYVWKSEEYREDLYAPLPTPEERGEVLKVLARNKPIDAEVDLMALGKDAACENFSGSDLFALVHAILSLH